jgi:thiamine-monophosphate kinase
MGLPGETALADVIELYEGIRETGVPVLGGDTTAAERVYLSVTALGRADRVPGRAGAKPGDLIVVTGPLGGAGAAFREGRYLPPPIRTEEGLRLGEVATAMLDVSDGLAVDAGHVARRSGCRLVIDLELVPRAGELVDLGFGEDFELLATTADPLGFPVIGVVEAGEGVELRLEGKPHELSGYEHFRT